MLWILEQNFRLVPLGIFLSDDAYLEPLPHNWCKRRRAFYGLLVFKKNGVLSEWTLDEHLITSNWVWVGVHECSLILMV